MNNIGILDISGININPLNNKPYSDTYKNLAEIWSKFPAYDKAESIIKDISENQVTLVISGTGSGKTVLLPKFVMHVLNYNKKIAITLPKQLIAKSAAEFAAKTLDVELGDIVGYQYKGSDKSGKSNNTKLLYATDGTIVSRLLKDPLLSEYSAVIIDEAHERKVQIDFLLYLLKNTLYNRPEFKLIIMSATINEDIFIKYFTDFKFITINVGAKTNYPIESIFLENSINNNNSYLDEGYKILKEIIQKDDLSKKESHDILFFITSSNEARKICTKISQDEDLLKDNYCIEVYSGMDNKKQEIATDKDKYKELYNKKRKIVLATNVAESSLTIDGIKYVIDSGLEFNSYFEPDYNAKVLNKILITQAQAKQRMGRAGRTESGYCYHLYTKDEFNNMKKFPEPTIRTSNIIDECLKFLAIESIKSLDNLLDIFTKFIEPPREKYIYYAFNDLKRLKLINKEDNTISELGLLINNINFDIYLTYACILAKKLNCLNEVLSICCLLDASKYNILDFFKTPNDLVLLNENNNNQKDYLNKKFKNNLEKYKSKYGDLTSLLKIFIDGYKIFDKTGHIFSDKLNDFFYINFLNQDLWFKAFNNYDRMHKMMRYRFNHIYIIPDITNNTDIGSRINSCFYYTFYNNSCILNNNLYDYKNLKLNLNQYSFNYSNKNLPHELFFIQLVNNSNKYEISITGKITESILKITKLF